MKQAVLAIVVTLAVCSGTALPAGAKDTVAPAAPGPAAVVQAFNRAISARKLEEATALLAAGSVQYTLRAAHAGATAAGGSVTSDLKTHWSAIGPVVFSVTTTYKRVPEILDTRVDADLATVWTRTASVTIERSGKQRKDSFTEVYLLVKAEGVWKIGAIADNRGTDRLSVAPAGTVVSP